MYIITCLGIVKLYQTRHPDIAANAHSVYAGFALIILIAVIGVVRKTPPTPPLILHFALNRKLV